MVKNFDEFFNLFEAKQKGLDLDDILDVPILLFEETGSKGNCYTDLEALKQFYRDMYAEELEDDPEFLKDQLKYIDEQSLESFGNDNNYKEWGFNKYLDSIRSTITEYFNTTEVDSDSIVYDKKSKMILVPVNNPQDDIEDYVEYIKDQNIFGIETCIGDLWGFRYDPEKELITIPADFSNLNAGYPKN